MSFESFNREMEKKNNVIINSLSGRKAHYNVECRCAVRLRVTQTTILQKTWFSVGLENLRGKNRVHYLRDGRNNMREKKVHLMRVW